MTTSTSSLRDQLHALLDSLNDADLDTVQRLIEARRVFIDEPWLLLHVAAPYEDEEISDEEEAAVEEARRDVRVRGTVSAEDAKRELLGRPSRNATSCHIRR